MVEKDCTSEYTQKKAGIATLTGAKVSFELGLVRRNKEAHLILIKVK
jgi:hypothetical protein